MLGVMSVFDEFGWSMIQERVHAGLRRARSERKRLGRPNTGADIERAILADLGKKDRQECA
jgi:DNA invertase Pin-like site-specific DNA recombinase